MRQKPVFYWTTIALLLLASLPIGVICHEVVGHGLTGVLCGGRITYIEVLGAALAELRWIGFAGAYGYANVEGVSGQTAQQLVLLNGSMSTWLISVAAVVLLWVRSWRGPARMLLTVLGFWWIDLFTYTLPTWGLRRSLFWGGLKSEPYDAAVALGVPGPLFQAFVVISSISITVAIIVRVRNRALDGTSTATDNEVLSAQSP